MKRILIQFARKRRTFVAMLLPIVLWLGGKPSLFTYLAGLFLVLLGQGIRFWAAGCINKAQKLASSGPYAYVRHPLYLGSLLIFLGFTLMNGQWWGWVLTLLTYLFFYGITILEEEKFLAEVLGEDYGQYCQWVPRLFPSRRPYPFAEGRFELRQVWLNKEYRSIIPVLLLCLLFGLKLF